MASNITVRQAVGGVAQRARWLRCAAFFHPPNNHPSAYTNETPAFNRACNAYSLQAKSSKRNLGQVQLTPACEDTSKEQKLETAVGRLEVAADPAARNLYTTETSQWCKCPGLQRPYLLMTWCWICDVTCATDDMVVELSERELGQ